MAGENILRLASGTEAYVKALRQALDTGREGAAVRQEVALDNTWRKRADRMWEEIARLLP